LLDDAVKLMGETEVHPPPAALNAPVMPVPLRALPAT